MNMAERACIFGLLRISVVVWPISRPACPRTRSVTILAGHVVRPILFSGQDYASPPPFLSPPQVGKRFPCLGALWRSGREGRTQVCVAQIWSTSLFTNLLISSLTMIGRVTTHTSSSPFLEPIFYSAMMLPNRSLPPPVFYSPWFVNNG